ncbi:MAG: hypothetical protein JJT95_01535 [Pararhodobacter sp.]|nr:hypothetical protein [Pararhodobacter sp.]
MPRSDFWSGLAVAAFGLLALLWMIPNYAGSNPFAQMPPGLVPSIAAWIMIICGVIVALGGVIGMLRDGLLPFTRAINWAGIGWALWPFLYVAVAIWFMTFIKITWFGAFLIGGMLILLGERRWYVILGCSVVPVVLLYILSVYMMRIGVV